MTERLTFLQIEPQYCLLYKPALIAPSYQDGRDFFSSFEVQNAAYNDLL